MRLSDVDIGEILKAQVVARLKEFGIKTSITTKTVGYELRCADPIPYDMEYTRDLGYCAAEYLLGGGNAAMISLQAGQFVPIPFDQLIDPRTGRTRVRLVNIHSTRYAIARRYMLRLNREDFEDPHELAKLAATCRLSLQDFRAQFEYPGPARAGAARRGPVVGARALTPGPGFAAACRRPPRSRRPPSRSRWRPGRSRPAPSRRRARSAPARRSAGP